MDNWIHLSKLQGLITEDINSIHCDTRDFHCILTDNVVTKDKKVYELIRSPKKCGKHFLINPEEIIPWLQSLEDMSEGKNDWRCLIFDNVKCDGWLKYIRFYRFNDKFIVCNGHSEAIDWQNCTKENLLVKYLGAHS